MDDESRLSDNGFWSQGGVRKDKPQEHADRHHFGTLREVIRFVMEDLDDLARASAFIETDVAPRDYSIDAIEKIYAEIKAG